MKAVIEEYGMLIASFLIGLTLIAALMLFTVNSANLKSTIPGVETTRTGDNEDLASQKKPVLVVESVSLIKGAKYNPRAYIKTASDSKSDLKDKVVIYGADKVDVNTIGKYKVIYSVTGSNGTVTSAISTVLIE